MARPLPVNLLLAGTGAVLMVSGLTNEPLGEVLKGNFGNLTNTATATTSNTSNSSVQAGEGGGGEAESQTESSPSNSTFAPSPDTFHKHVSTNEEAKSVASILLSEGISHPTTKQIQEARELYHRK